MQKVTDLQAYIVNVACNLPKKVADQLEGKLFFAPSEEAAEEEMNEWLLRQVELALWYRTEYLDEEKSVCYVAYMRREEYEAIAS